MTEDTQREESQTQGTQTSSAPPEGEVILPTVPDVVRWFIAELSQHAWIHLGLVANPATRLVVKDLPQARLAIDSVAALIEQLQPQLVSEEKHELATLLSNLRINYVQQSQ